MTSWQTKKLGEVLEKIEGGGTPSKAISHYWGGTIPWASVKDVVTHNPAKTVDHITVDGLEHSSSKLIRAGTLITPTRMALGRAVFFSIDVAINQDLKALYPSPELDKVFLQYWFENNKGKIQHLGIGSTVAGIQLSELRSLPFDLPSKAEQHNIVLILETWDAYLRLLDQVMCLKELLLKGSMQHLLSGKYRLPGFTSQWTEMRLDHIARIEKGKSLTSKDLIPGPYPVIAGGQKSPYSHARYTHQKVVTISASGAYAGFVSYHTEKIWASDCSVVTSNPAKSMIEYIYYYLLNNQDHLYAAQVGGAQPHVYPKDIAQMKMHVPSLDEQAAIIAVLTNLNEQIKVHRAIKKQAQQQKLFLLRNLLRGTIRTPDALVMSGENQ